MPSFVTLTRAPMDCAHATQFHGVVNTPSLLVIPVIDVEPVRKDPPSTSSVTDAPATAPARFVTDTVIVVLRPRRKSAGCAVTVTTNVSRTNAREGLLSV